MPRQTRNRPGSGRFATELLAKAHKRDDFTCGNNRIASYFRETVSQNVKR